MKAIHFPSDFNVEDHSRFWAQVDKSPDGCWLWTGSKNAAGYGRFMLRGKNHAAHRIAFHEIRGPIPDGYVLDHLCRNRLCVNPSHLSIVTNRLNILRGTGFSARNIVKTHCKHGHSLADARIIRDGPNVMRQCRECVRIRNRMAWRAKKARSLVIDVDLT